MIFNFFCKTNFHVLLVRFNHDIAIIWRITMHYVDLNTFDESSEVGVVKSGRSRAAKLEGLSIWHSFHFKSLVSEVLVLKISDNIKASKVIKDYFKTRMELSDRVCLEINTLAVI